MSISFSAEEDVTTSLYIPITTANHLAGSPEGYSTVTVQASAGDGQRRHGPEHPGVPQPLLRQ